MVELIKARKSSFEETFIFDICPLEPGGDISTNPLPNFGRGVVSTQGQPVNNKKNMNNLTLHKTMTLIKNPGLTSSLHLCHLTIV